MVFCNSFALTYDKISPLRGPSPANINLMSYIPSFFKAANASNKKKMPFYATQTIESFNKPDLFYRFSLDNYAAIHIYKTLKKRLNPYIETLYNETIKRTGEEKLMKRVEKVKRATFKPNFRKFVGKQYSKSYRN